jgi:hypothetical protein
MTHTHTLREKAEKATKGPWERRHDDEVWEPQQNRWVASSIDEDADFIAAANPSAVIALLDEIDRLTRERDEAVSGATAARQNFHTMQGTASELKAEIDRLRGVLRPLASLAWQPEVLPTDDTMVIASFANMNITAGDARAARSALTPPEKP